MDKGVGAGGVAVVEGGGAVDECEGLAALGSSVVRCRFMVVVVCIY